MSDRDNSEGRPKQTTSYSRQRANFGGQQQPRRVERRGLLLGTTALAASATALAGLLPRGAMAQQVTSGKTTSGKKPNILVIWGDDVGIWNISAYHRGMMATDTPNIDRIAREGMLFMDHYAQASCTAGRAAFITGQHPLRVGLSTVGLAGSPQGLQKEDPTLAEMLKPLGYATGQFGKNHLGDRDEHLPTAHGFDEFFGILYHLTRISQR